VGGLGFGSRGSWTAAVAVLGLLPVVAVFVVAVFVVVVVRFTLALFFFPGLELLVVVVSASPHHGSPLAFHGRKRSRASGEPRSLRS